MKMEPKIAEPEKKRKKTSRSKRGSGITKKIPIVANAGVEDDDPFVDCDKDRWSLKTALEHITKTQAHTKKVNINPGFKGQVSASTFECFSNTLVVGLFNMYSKLETELQNSLRIFYFGLEEKNPSRFRNLTNSLHRQNTFYLYPWLTTDEKLREVFDIKELYKKKKDMRLKAKPFSEACKQYALEKRKCSKLQQTVEAKIEPKQINDTPDIYSTSVNVPNTSLNNFNNTNSQILFNQNDKHLLLSQEYNNMISAINCNHQYNSVIDNGNKLNENKQQILEDTTERKRKANKTSRWSDAPIEPNITKTRTPTTISRPNLKPIQIINKLTPLMHFENRKIKLTTEAPLSLGDLIVLVSYFYKLEYMEQQLLIEKMKVLETTKPNQAAYLRQYVRTTCPLYDDHIIQFKPLPQELIMSELNMDLHNVKCIEDILENDFCLSEVNLYGKRIKIEDVPEDCLNDKHTSNEFDFGSAFL